MQQEIPQRGDTRHGFTRTNVHTVVGARKKVPYGLSLDFLFLARVPALVLIQLFAGSYFWGLAGCFFS